MKMGGMERASVNLANSLHWEKQDVTYISFFKQDHFFKLHPGINLIEPAGFNIHSLSFLRTIFWLRSVIRKMKPDSVIVFNKLYGAITCLSLIGTNEKVYLSERSSPLYQWPKIQNILINIIFSLVKPYGVISQTNIAKEYQVNYFGKNVKIDVVPNALREITFYPEIKREKIILAVGRLNDPLKGFDRLLQAFALIEQEDWVLTFAGGQTDEDPLLSKIISDNNLHKKVQFLGKVQDMDRVYASASIFVIPSRSEGFPNALCEAMAAGLACISFDFVAGPRDILTENENGILVEDGNIERLAIEMERLMQGDEERQRLGNNAKKIINKYNSSVISKKLLKFLADE